jgi:hypothetical protein
MELDGRLDDTVVQFLNAEYARYLPAKPTYPQQSLTDRVRRSLSWIERAICASPEDTPTRFLELWIALNSLYGCRRYEQMWESKEQDEFRHFMEKLRTLDASILDLPALMKRIGLATSKQLVKNKYLWKDFWQEHKGAYESKSKAAWEKLEASFIEEDPVTFFRCLFERLCVLRNQIAHGSSSVTTAKSWDALDPGIHVLELALPVFLRIMIQQGRCEDWPEIPYPGKDTPQHPRWR